MKKRILALLIALILTTSAAMAESLDLSGLTFDELLDLQQRVNDALWESSEMKHVRVPSGYYTVGKEIPAGHWTITPADYTTFFCFYESLSAALNDGNALYYSDLSDDESYSVYAEDGMGVWIDGAVYFTTYTVDFTFD